MMLFRCARARDLDQIYDLSLKSGVGLTTLPKDKKLLRARLKWATRSFKKNVTAPESEYYWFVLEDLERKKIIGISAIESKIGTDVPFYNYKLTKRTRVCHSLDLRVDYEVLNLVNDMQGHSEMCTLYLSPRHRKNNNGLLLSKARFLFIAEHPHRFAKTIIAEMRGISDKKGNSPFWDAIGSNFFHMPFEQADRLTTATNKQFIADLMPRNPIYIKLINQKAQEVIGKPHASTLPAMKILEREGFRYNNYVDIFDAGPTIEAPRDKIRSVAESLVFTIHKTSDEVSSERYFIATTGIDFKATIGNVIVNLEKNTCIISKSLASVLRVKKGDKIRVLPLKMDVFNRTSK